jgi:lysophospholipase L1-like esterase
MHPSFFLKSRISFAAFVMISGLGLISNAFAAEPDKGAAKPDKGEVALSRLVVIGDSLSAGFQNFSLFTGSNGGQTFGFASLIAQQAAVNLTLPTISSPGIPPELMLNSGQIVRAAGLGSRTNPSMQATNLSVPGFTVADVLAHPYPGNPSATNVIDLLSDTVLGTPQGHLPCGPIPTSLLSAVPLPASISSLIPSGSPAFVSEAACAARLVPTTVIVSIGSNDVLQALTLGNAPTDPAVFATNYGYLLDVLSITGANIIVSNVPDVTALPFVVNASTFLQQCGTSIPAPYSYVVPNLGAPAFNVCEYNVPLTAAQISGLQALVVAYNQAITAQVAAFRAHGGSATIVDINGLLKNLSANGITIDSKHLTTAFLGGLFSLDGIHPTNTGYAILANAYIDAINSALGTNIKDVVLPPVANHDPLIFP